jgi:transketolase
MNEHDLQKLQKTANEIRYMTIKAIGDLGVGHIGGSMSIIEVLTVLYYKLMKVDAENPKDPNRDKLVLSKGHAGPALYSTLAKKGFFPAEWLETMNRGGTNLPSHCDKNRTPGIDMTTGSLGQGLSASIGLALADRIKGRENNVFCIIGDGESDEGQVWEAAMAAAHFKLDKLIAFTDYNKMNIDGYTADIMNLDDIGAKWTAFNWHVQRVNGHDMDAISDAVDRARKETCRPSMIILDTIKGKGCTFGEGKLSSHNTPITEQQRDEALAALLA